MATPPLAAADSVPPQALHAAFLAAFDGYVAGTPDLPFDRWLGALARQAVSLPHSRVALAPDGAVLAFALTARRADASRWRLAIMGAVPQSRGGGAAPALLDDLIARAAAAGQHAVELECFAQNPRALALYGGRGFVERHALLGHRKAPPHEPAPAQEPPGVCSVASALEWLGHAVRAIDDLPLQVTAAALAHLPQPWTAWRLGTAQLVFGEPGPDRCVVHSCVDLDPAQRDAEQLLRRLCAAAGERTIVVPPLQRDDVGGAAMRRAGFEPAPLHQVWMARAC